MTSTGCQIVNTPPNKPTAKTTEEVNELFRLAREAMPTEDSPVVVTGAADPVDKGERLYVFGGFKCMDWWKMKDGDSDE